MVREARFAWNDLGRSSGCEFGLRKLFDDPVDVEELSFSEDAANSCPAEYSSERKRSTKKKSARRNNGKKNLADADWMNWE